MKYTYRGGTHVEYAINYLFQKQNAQIIAMCREGTNKQRVSNIQ